MDELNVDLRTNLENLSKCHQQLASELQRFLSKKVWSPSDRTTLLDTLTRLLLLPEHTENVCHACRAFILELLHRAVRRAERGQWSEYQRFAVALSRVVELCPDTERFCVEYFSGKALFLHNPDTHNEPPVKKKKSKSSKKRKSDVSDDVLPLCDVMQAVYRLVINVSDVIKLWDWSSLADYVTHDDVTVRWHALQTISHVTNMADDQRRRLVAKHLTTDQINNFTLKTEQPSTVQILRNVKSSRDDVITSAQTHTMGALVTSDLSDHVVSVCGVMLDKAHDEEAETMEVDICDSLVAVSSCERNLRTLALSVAAGRPVLLRGPVGSGKTALVEHLARVTGRESHKHLLKIQLGDQTDSKSLVGTYKCTHVPGEFVWTAGPLTTCMVEGRWLLLEDIDYAPMDVVSVLLPVMRGGDLVVPGRSQPVRAASGFQIFATQRVHGGVDGWYSDVTGHASLLDKLWTIVNVEPLSCGELKQVIISRHPGLSSVADRLLEVYFLLTSSHGDVTDTDDVIMSSADYETGTFATREGRLVSTRDLMKWCSRIACDPVIMTSSSVTSSDRVFREALDCFTGSIPDQERRRRVSVAIGAKLNENEAKANYYFRSYKPDVEESGTSLVIGRETLDRKEEDLAQSLRRLSDRFAFTRPALCLLERIAVCVNHREPILLCGETGNGKTSTVQFLAGKLGRKLHVINMNQQSDSTDLLGGYKPMELKYVISPVREKFEILFCQCYSRKQNLAFLGHLQTLYAKRRWTDLVKLMEHPTRKALVKFKDDPAVLEQWREVLTDLHQLKVQATHADSALAFSFVEGTLVRAMKAGDWVLLDEINLASAETLECLSGLLETGQGSVTLVERGDSQPVARHADFRLFACMNPATDVGKKDLPSGIRNRFTEFFVDDLDSEADLRVLVSDYLRGLAVSTSQVEGIIKFYRRIRAEAQSKLVDGTGHKPHYSLRTLCRALRQCSLNQYSNAARSLYEGFCFSFLTQLDRQSHPVVERLIAETILNKKSLKSLLKQPIAMPQDGEKYLQFEGYWVRQGTQEPMTSDKYVMTPSVRLNLRDLVRVVASGQQPVLIQGETSVGKTSLIRHLAEASGNVCLRVNNHEHTDLQEYVGCYAADEKGRLVFKEGVLVDAMRKGYWIILDELNLAPTDVLEALNRLLDDNRELFIPETQQTVKAHAQFMLFATQNPPGQYGGRKVLSRAFRNRFVELHFDELPSCELELILHERCLMPMSYCKRLVAVMVDLQVISAEMTSC